MSNSRRHLPEIKRTLILAGPIMLGQLSGFGMNFVDVVMAGRLGANALAAIAIGGSLWSAWLMLVIGMTLAVPPAISQLDGAGRRREAGATMRQALWISVVLSMLMSLGLRNSQWFLQWLKINPQVVPTAVGYLQALSWGAPGICLTFALRLFSEGTGRTRPTMYVGFLGLLLNIPLNYVLMFGKLGFPPLGAVGCGYATSIVVWLQVIYMYVYILRHDHYRPFALFERFSAPDWRRIKALLAVGLPISVMLLLEGGLFIGASLLIGRLDQSLLAAHQIAINFAAVTFMIPLGLSGAITVRVGNAIGRGDPGGARYAGMIGIFIALGFQTVSAMLMLLFPKHIVALYTQDLAVASVAASLLFFAAIFQLSDGIQVCAAGALRGLKDTRIPLLYSSIAYWLIGMTLGYQLTFSYEMGPKGMWTGMIAGLSIAAVLMTLRFRQVTRRLIARHREAVSGD